MDIYNKLRLRSDASKEEIKSKYYKLLSILHPRTKGTGNEIEYLELQKLYKRYLLGDDCTNCFYVCSNNTKSISCRCGGVYEISDEYIGRLDCDFCSCFIFVEEKAKEIS